MLTNKPLTDAELDELDKLMAKATEGPLTVELDAVRTGDIDVFAPGDSVPGVPVAYMAVRDHEDDVNDLPRETALANAELFARMRTEGPRLVAEVRELRQRIDAAANYQENTMNCGDCCDAVASKMAAILRGDA